MVKYTYKVGDKVFAKVKGYPPWPAKIVGESKQKYNVIFYGTQEIGSIKPENILYYLKAKQRILQKHLKRAGYEDAVNEIEEAIKTDGGDGSSLKGDENPGLEFDMSDSSAKSSASEKKGVKRASSFHVTAEPPAKKSPPFIGESGNSSQAEVASDTDQHEKETSPENKHPTEEKKANENTVDKVQTDTSKTDDVNTNAIQPPQETVSETKINAQQEIETVKDIAITEESKTKGSKKQPMAEADAIDDPKFPAKTDIITDQELQNYIKYARHVRENESAFKEKPVEHRTVNKNEIFAIQLPSGKICGFKLHKTWPLEHQNEFERALYDEEVAKALLKLKEDLTKDEKNLSDVQFEVIAEVGMNAEDLKEIAHARDIDSKRKRIERLKKEAEIVSWDSKIKNCLGLDKAVPEDALAALKNFEKVEKDMDLLALKKHPHVVDTLRRLRKYVGNTEAWNMTAEAAQEFDKKAEVIRQNAEVIYDRIRRALKIKGNTATFWDKFMEVVADFREKCKGLTEGEILVLCAEPDSRKAFLDRLSEVTPWE